MDPLKEPVGQSSESELEDSARSGFDTSRKMNSSNVASDPLWDVLSPDGSFVTMVTDISSTFISNNGQKNKTCDENQ